MVGDSMSEKRKPRELLPDILGELNELFAAVEKEGEVVDGDEWANPLMSVSTDFLRNLADFRDGVQEAGLIYPDEWFDRPDSPDLEDPDMSAWHELTEWFAEHGLLARADDLDEIEP